MPVFQVKVAVFSSVCRVSRPVFVVATELRRLFASWLTSAQSLYYPPEDCNHCIVLRTIPSISPLPLLCPHHHTLPQPAPPPARPPCQIMLSCPDSADTPGHGIQYCVCVHGSAATIIMGMSRPKQARTPVVLWLCWPITILLAGCCAFCPVDRLSQLEDSDLAVRIQAIKWAGENKVAAAVPLLVDRLLDKDPSARLYAILALREITGEQHGYNYGGDLVERYDATNRWRQAIAAPDTVRTFN